MNVYEKLREVLDASPTGAPPSKAFDEILRILFTPEEAGIAVHMTLFPRPLKSIAYDAGISEGEASRLLEAMAGKAVIIARQKGDLVRPGCIVFREPDPRGPGYPGGTIIGGGHPGSCVWRGGGAHQFGGLHRPGPVCLQGKCQGL